MDKYALALALSKTLAEIEDMSVDEFHGWMAYFKLRGSK